MGKAFVGNENQLKMKIIESMKLKFQVHLETLQKSEALNATHSSFAL